MFLIKYKFIIHYILKKENSRANTLSRKKNHIKITKIFNYSIFTVSKDRLLLVNKYKYNNLYNERQPKEAFYRKKNFIFPKTKLIELLKNTIIDYYKII